jgi:phosphate starvation-inducible protein PhoH
MRLFSPPLIALLAALALSACSPQYNWRDYRSADAPYSVMFPDKPDTHTREIDLNGLKVKMLMTAVQVDGATYAVGTGEAPDAGQAQAALASMKTALIKNIGATITKETVTSAIDIEATGTQNGKPMLLHGHFVARDKRFYQVIAVGPKQAMSAEQTEMFMSSFKLN